MQYLILLGLFFIIACVLNLIGIWLLRFDVLTWLFVCTLKGHDISKGYGPYCIRCLKDLP